MGSGLSFLRQPVAHVQHGHDVHGDVFTMALGPKTIAILIGPRVAAEFFRQPGDVLSVSLATKALQPVMGKVAFPDTPQAHRRLLDAVVPLVSNKHMTRYVEVMLEEARRTVIALPAQGRFELVELTERLSQTIAIRCFLGDAFAARIDERFRDAFSDLIKSVDMFLPPNLPLPKFRRRDRARRYIGELIDTAVKERRAMAEPPADAMQRLSTLRDPDGGYWNLQDTVDLIVSLLFGGHHTTGTLMAWTVVHLQRNPRALAKVREEIDELRPLKSASLQGATYLSAAVQESQRIEPPSGFIIRVARENLEIGGYEIRKGWLVALCPPVSQRLSEVFEEPDDYQPERFLEGRSLPPHAIVGFGGGPHACVGRPFALLAVRAFVATILSEYELKLVGTPVVDAKEVLRRPVIPCLVDNWSRGAISVP